MPPGGLTKKQAATIRQKPVPVFTQIKNMNTDKIQLTPLRKLCRHTEPVKQSQEV